MKIAIDFDDVIVNTVDTFLNFHNQKYELSRTREDINSTDLRSFWGCTKNEAISLMKEFHDSSSTFENAEPINGAIEFLKEISKDNEIVIITGRPSQFKEKTLYWLNKYLSDVNVKLFFSGDYHHSQGKTKAEICEELGINVIIEDDINYAKPCLEKGIEVIIIDKPWNQVDLNRIHRAHSWKEVNSFLKSLSQ
ncbi:hypothetical protein COU54_04520 [Candidatus Pacearchaeota archaeon CG10_big_fil_rev_8_21_14_0_10_31_24]|nr:MAG: hypothetical protein COU54_04520 [Candidatus Pacearchaeota archaeon CG10_big_fil_rev_8_21_14_0_10_31_24]